MPEVLSYKIFITDIQLLRIEGTSRYVTPL